MPQEKRKAEGDAHNAQLLEDLQCSVCIQPIDAEIYQCKEGHLICTECKKTLPAQKCPTCGCTDLSGRCRALEKIAERTTDNCPHPGCEHSNTLPKLRTHKTLCTHGPLKCMVADCKFVAASPSELIDHVSTGHKFPIHKNTNNTLKFALSPAKDQLQSNRFLAVFDLGTDKYVFRGIRHAAPIHHGRCFVFRIPRKGELTSTETGGKTARIVFGSEGSRRLTFEGVKVIDYRRMNPNQFWDIDNDYDVELTDKHFWQLNNTKAAHMPETIVYEILFEVE
eukprot:GDKI01001995.1.p1 GENE.GDKI01001995.1~~GDKI01001995.1.p1  ORF type:complete len:280 (-),score=40.91 GDKI01001995.1:351-1190(-)